MSKIGQIGISAVNVALKSKNIYFSIHFACISIWRKFRLNSNFFQCKIDDLYFTAWSIYVASIG